MGFAVPIKILGVLLALFSTTMLPPALIAFIAEDGEGLAFVGAFAVLLLAGALLWLPLRKLKRDLRTRDGFLVVTLFWSVLGLAGALPFLLGEHLQMSFTDAVFESVSGFTTTGASVLVGIENLPMSIRYYRQQLNWLGGMGMIVLALAILPMLGVGGMQLYKAEVPGPAKDEKLTPRINDTAKLLWFIYLGLTVACTLAFWLGGMSLFNAIAYAFSAISTGGFAPHDASMGFFDDPLLDMIGTLFMILGGLNFALHYTAWHRRTLRPYWTDPECWHYLVYLSLALVVVVAALALSSTLPFWQALRHGLFQLATFSTSTGLVSTSYGHWPGGLLVLLLFIGIIGGCAGSTAGGMKFIRALLLYKQGGRQMRLLVHPRAVQPVKLGRSTVDHRILDAVWGFFALYVALFVVFMLVLVATGLDQVTAFSAVVATINNLGIGIAGVGGGFGGLPDTAKWTLMLAMLMGRLELFTVVVLFMPAFWRG